MQHDGDVDAMSLHLALRDGGVDGGGRRAAWPSTAHALRVGGPLVAAGARPEPSANPPPLVPLVGSIKASCCVQALPP